MALYCEPTQWRNPMKIQIESTSKIVELQVDGKNIPASVWEGQTESGVPVHCFITRLAPTIPRDDPRQTEFVRELKEQRTPSAEIAVLPLRLIL